MRNSVVVIVPMKPLEVTKTRLSGLLNPSQRANLSLSMLRTVLDAAVGSRAAEVRVIGGDHAVATEVRNAGAVWLSDETAGLNDALASAFEAASVGNQTPMYLAGDLPFIGPEDVDAVIDMAERLPGSVVLAPASNDNGTNSIVSPASSGYLPDLGTDSFERHRLLAHQMGLAVVTCDRPGLGLDLDTPDDWATYLLKCPQLINSLGELAPSGLHTE